MNHIGSVPCIFGPVVLVLGRFRDLFPAFGESICPPGWFGGQGVVNLLSVVFFWSLT